MRSLHGNHHTTHRFNGKAGIHTYTHLHSNTQKTPPNGTNKLNARTLTNRLLSVGENGHMVAQRWQFSDIVREMLKEPSQSLKRKRKQI